MRLKHIIALFCFAITGVAALLPFFILLTGDNPELDALMVFGIVSFILYSASFLWLSTLNVGLTNEIIDDYESIIKECKRLVTEWKDLSVSLISAGYIEDASERECRIHETVDEFCKEQT